MLRTVAGARSPDRHVLAEPLPMSSEAVRRGLFTASVDGVVTWMGAMIVIRSP